jgi:hypothetical protein
MEVVPGERLTEVGGVLRGEPRLLEARHLLLIIRALGGRQDEVAWQAVAVAGNALGTVAAGGFCGRLRAWFVGHREASFVALSSRADLPLISNL